MKLTIFRYHLVTLFILLASVNLLSQQNSDDEIKFAFSVDGHNVKIRWQPTEQDLYMLLREKGYSLEREKIKTADNFLQPSERSGTRTVICENCLPKSKSEYRNMNFPNMAIANALDSLWFGEINPVFTGSPLKDAIKESNFESNRYTTMVILTSRDFELAKAFGLGVEDELNENEIYEYKLTIDTKIFTFTVNTEASNLLPTPVIMSTQGGDSIAAISYNQSALQNNYIGYFFEKSLDSISFYPVNEHPYLSSGKRNAEVAKADIFIDSLNSNGVKYYYRMRGQTIFGEFSPYSNVVSVKGVPDRLDLTPILGVKLINEGSVLLQLSDIPDELENLISNITIFKSLSPVDGFRVVRPDFEIRAEDQEFLDDTLDETYYYLLTYVDVFGHKYKSNSLLVQPKDSIPPSIPEGLVVTADNNGNILARWSSNTENDLNGYRLYRANGRDESFIDVTGDNIRDTFFNDLLSNKVLIDSVFYKMIATDIRGNYSDYSQIVGISRPDAVPPSDPVIFAGIPGLDGIYISWSPSQSKDVTYHALERSSDTQPKWEELLTFTPKDSNYYTAQQYLNFNFNYLDNKGLYSQQYRYRLIAYDDNGNFSTSNMINVTPLPVVVEGSIVSFDGSYVCDSTLNQLTLQQFTGLNTAINSISSNGSSGNVTSNLLSLLQNGYISVATYQALAGLDGSRVTLQLTSLSNDLIGNSKKICKIKLQWVYASNHPIEEVKFEIYRAVNSYNFDLYKVVDANQIQLTDGGIEYTDIYVSPGRKYNYKIVALNPNNTKSKISKVVSLLLN